jgi:hypothetical protein
MAFEFVSQPQTLIVPQNVSSAQFTASAIDDLFPSRTVTYQWRRQDTGGTPGYNNIVGATSNTLTLAPIESFDNDTFVVLASSASVGQPLSSNIVTFGIRLSGDRYSEWETTTETGVNRVRRLQVLGYL